VQIVRQEVNINGIVQGVGFRPFVYKLAQQHRLTGFVANTTHGVEIEVEGEPSALQSFLCDLKAKAPPLAVLDRITARPIEPRADHSFAIHTSTTVGTVATQIAPDVAVCNDCLAELFDPADRRYRYPFINCTNCGPRYTIIENIPYDRPSTSMRNFTMCGDCLAEYNDPVGRRFHAQPNCCPVCGPQVSLRDRDKEISQKGDAILATRNLLLHGSILAIKGLGGFHLAVDAANDQAVQELRIRKRREEKPFALMVGNLQTAEAICVLNREEIAALTSQKSPIVLAPKKDGHNLADSIAPGNDLFGIMLPSTPLHHLLFDESGPAVLVMTSANLSEEPICIDNHEAVTRLSTIADYFLVHDRPIYLRNDDAIVIHLAGKTRLVRRSRGYAPQPLRVDSTGPPLLAVGGELKNTVCLMKNGQAILSQHIGDLKNLEAYHGFQKTIDHLLLVFATKPELIVHDLHSQYLSTRWAKEQKGAPKLAVQHHHAHLAACLAENHTKSPAIGLIMDGTGYGSDGTIWGGEILIGDGSGFRRFGHFEPLPLPGGDAAVQEPWRAAVGWLHATYGSRMPEMEFMVNHDIDPIIEITAKKINTPLTSSCGRLFDVVAAMSGGRTKVYYEAQAAIEFMQAAGGLLNRPYSYDILDNGSVLQIATQSLLRSVVDGLQAGETYATVSQRFHQTLVELFVEITLRASLETGIKTVAISGGVFQNQLLFSNLVPALDRAGFTVLTHSLSPTNDGCVSLGQAMIGRCHLQKE
jgi:hydrogenase maturation protein HypF